jgi:hypothetical protein
VPELAGRPRSGARERRLAAGTGLALALALGPALPASAAPADPATPATRCQLTDPRLPEVSGLVEVGDRMLVHNDGGDSLDVYVLDGTCAVVTVHSAPVDPYDPEDMALAVDGTVWLADTGDNDSTRTTVALLALHADGSSSVYRLAYPDGPRDDFVVTGTPGGPVGRAGQLMVTGGAVSPDERWIALRTYTDAYVWPLTGSDVAGALAGEPRRVPLPAAAQGEAVSFTARSSALVVAGEGLPSDVTVVPLPAGAASPSGAAAADGGVSGLLSGDDGPLPVAAAAAAAVVAGVFVWLGSMLFRRRD